MKYVSEVYEIMSFSIRKEYTSMISDKSSKNTLLVIKEGKVVEEHHDKVKRLGERIKGYLNKEAKSIENLYRMKNPMAYSTCTYAIITPSKGYIIYLTLSDKVGSNKVIRTIA